MFGTELRAEARLRIVESGGIHEVRVPHPNTGETVPVTREEIWKHAEADHRVLEAA